MGGGGCGGRWRGYSSPLARRYRELCSDSVAVTGATAAWYRNPRLMPLLKGHLQVPDPPGKNARSHGSRAPPKPSHPPPPNPATSHPATPPSTCNPHRYPRQHTHIGAYTHTNTYTHRRAHTVPRIPPNRDGGEGEWAGRRSLGEDRRQRVGRGRA